jgi:hypothetical protein
LTNEQRLAFGQAGKFVLRNAPVDREKALKVLGGAFEEVYGIPYWNTWALVFASYDPLRMWFFV